MSTGREKALEAYRQAREPGDWQAAAELLFKAMPKPRKKRGRKGDCVWPPPIVETRFACGYRVAFSTWTRAGEDPDFERGKRLAESHYRFKFGCEPRVTGRRLIPEAEWRARYTDAPTPPPVRSFPKTYRPGGMNRAPERLITQWMIDSDAYWRPTAEAA